MLSLDKLGFASAFSIAAIHFAPEQATANIFFAGLLFVLLVAIIVIYDNYISKKTARHLAVTDKIHDFERDKEHCSSWDMIYIAKPSLYKKVYTNFINPHINPKMYYDGDVDKLCSDKNKFKSSIVDVNYKIKKILDDVSIFEKGGKPNYRHPENLYIDMTLGFAAVPSFIVLVIGWIFSYKTSINILYVYFGFVLFVFFVQAKKLYCTEVLKNPIPEWGRRKKDAERFLEPFILALAKCEQDGNTYFTILEKETVERQEEKKKELETIEMERQRLIAEEEARKIRQEYLDRERARKQEFREVAGQMAEPTYEDNHRLKLLTSANRLRNENPNMTVTEAKIRAMEALIAEEVAKGANAKARFEIEYESNEENEDFSHFAERIESVVMAKYLSRRLADLYEEKNEEDAQRERARLLYIQETREAKEAQEKHVARQKQADDQFAAIVQSQQNRQAQFGQMVSALSDLAKKSDE